MGEGGIKMSLKRVCPLTGEDKMHPLTLEAGRWYWQWTRSCYRVNCVWTFSGKSPCNLLRIAGIMLDAGFEEVWKFKMIFDRVRGRRRLRKNERNVEWGLSVYNFSDFSAAWVERLRYMAVTPLCMTLFSVVSVTHSQPLLESRWSSFWSIIWCDQIIPSFVLLPNPFIFDNCFLKNLWAITDL